MKEFFLLDEPQFISLKLPFEAGSRWFQYGTNLTVSGLPATLQVALLDNMK